MNHRKVFGTLAGFVVLAGISYHQVRDAGPDPLDTAIMSGTVVSSDRAARRAVDANDAPCDASPAARSDGAEAGTDCPQNPR